MIKSKLDKEASILYLYPESSIAKEDFEKIAKEIDPYIDNNGLHSIVVEAAQFPGWESFGAMSEHLKFAKEHQKRVEKIVIITDSVMGKIIEHLGKHFVSAKIKNFPITEREEAYKWAKSVLN